LDCSRFWRQNRGRAAARGGAPLAPLFSGTPDRPCRGGPACALFAAGGVVVGGGGGKARDGER